MIIFFRGSNPEVFAVQTKSPLAQTTLHKLSWLFSGAHALPESTLKGPFVGPRVEMVTPWSTNAVEITQNMGIEGIERIEQFFPFGDGSKPDKMLEHVYPELTQNLFDIHVKPAEIISVTNINEYNQKEGLALSAEEVTYLEGVSKELGRPLTDSEVFGFSQVNSEHCRHKIFNGTFVIDGAERPVTLFQLIKQTSKENPNYIVSAYKDNVAFIAGPVVEQFAPSRQDAPEYFQVTDFESVISLKAETHNFPTTVEPFNGAATGSGGEIRDRLAGGKGSLPLAGTAVYMTAYPRLAGQYAAGGHFKERPWLYQTPAEILIKASDGASDFGNKFGQPLIGGSVLTFEHFNDGKSLAFDKVIMLAGGIGYGKKKDAAKGALKAGDRIVMMGGDNYRIGMGGGAVSSVATGEFGNAIELNAIQRSNPEMQKRVMNAIRAMVEAAHNPIVSIHDHGAGGHLNCFSELLEETGGEIHVDALPVGDPTLSVKEILSNESQERMGIAIHESDIEKLRVVSARERAPFYVTGVATGNSRYTFGKKGETKQAVDFKVDHLLGASPKTIIKDSTSAQTFDTVELAPEKFETYLERLLQLEAVACKDWLTNKVDRSVTGKVATQQACGELQLPLNNVGVMALDFNSNKGIATAIGHAPGAAIVNPTSGSQLAIAEALTNIVWAPLSHGLKGVSLSANWMWPAKSEGESARLYEAVKAVSEFAIALGINIPTGKDSLSMSQKYPDGTKVDSPGTVIISAVAEVHDIRRTVSPDLKRGGGTLLYIPFTKNGFALGGSSVAQVLGKVGEEAPQISDAPYFAACFEIIQQWIASDKILAGHDVGGGGLITTLLEMCFPSTGMGMDLDVSAFGIDWLKAMFAENPGVVVQVVDKSVTAQLEAQGLLYFVLGASADGQVVTLKTLETTLRLDVALWRNVWFHTSFLLDSIQRTKGHAATRQQNIFRQPLQYKLKPGFDGLFDTLGIDAHRRKPTGVKAAIIREKGVNGDREMAWALYLAGFDVKDVHMTDLIAGREDLKEVNMIVFVGGFSNSDVLGSAKGWAGAFLYNPRAKQALDEFYARPDTLSLGVCNGCQLMMELGLVHRDWPDHPKMHHNGSGKFESIFALLEIPANNSVMLSTLAGCKLGAWVAHGEGRFNLKSEQRPFQVAVKYAYPEYPGNPNDSDFATAALVSTDGRHLAIMPHIERSVYPWNWPHYPEGKVTHEVGPWVEAFVNARDWVAARTGK